MPSGCVAPREPLTLSCRGKPVLSAFGLSRMQTYLCVQPCRMTLAPARPLCPVPLIQIDFAVLDLTLFFSFEGVHTACSALSRSDRLPLLVSNCYFFLPLEGRCSIFRRRPRTSRAHRVSWASAGRRAAMRLTFPWKELCCRAPRTAPHLFTCFSSLYLFDKKKCRRAFPSHSRSAQYNFEINISRLTRGFHKCLQ